VIDFWNGSLRWQSLRKWHLTLSRFWPKLAWDEESSNWNQSRPSSRKEVPLTPSSIFSAVAQNKLLFLRTVKRRPSPFAIGDFIGQESLATVGGLRLASVTAITACTALKIEREEMARVIHEEHSFTDLFVKFLLAHSMRAQADLIDQLFNSSEKRLARILLLMAEFGKPGEPEPLIPKITQETLAEMIGTTRSRVSFFMNRFRKLGFVEYNGGIRVHKSLLNVVLHDWKPKMRIFTAAGMSE
jgi:hypothetical protein